jgi:phytoene dehydrogenase-like protein
MPYMDRIIGSKSNNLISYINARVSTKDQVNQIPYLFTSNYTFRRFNDIIVYNQVPPTANVFNASISTDGTVDPYFATLDPSVVWGRVTKTLTDALTKNFLDGFNLLMNYDSQSIRAHLLAGGFTDQQIDWMETIDDATDHYDMYSMSQGVLEQWIFTQSGTNWTCINGGMDRIISGMIKIIKKRVAFNSKVTAIAPGSGNGLRVTINGNRIKEYAHVISTLPLGALQVVDLTQLDIGYKQRNAIRKLNYDPSMKIGIKFRTRW